VTDDPLAAGLAADLAAWGKVIVLHTIGRRTGRDRAVTVGFLEDDGGCLSVAATDDRTDWARNLLADARCRVTFDGGTRPYRACLLDAADHDRVVTGLILRYGTPAERLGRGPAFRLCPGDGEDGPVA
jgi:deazaflavin-dependent oxidoreductase (nitroreductase family)